MDAANGDAVLRAGMGFLDRVKNTVIPSGSGIEYQCPACGYVFDTADERCPKCGELDVRERGSFEFQPE